MQFILSILLVSWLGLAQTGSLEDPGSHAGKGDQLMRRQLYEAAATEFETALRDQPDLKLARYHYAICLFAIGRNDAARVQFERLEKESGPTPEVTYYRARLDLLDGKTAPAIQEFRSLEGNPKTPDAAYFLGLSYVAAGDTTSGLKWLERAAKATPRDYHVHYRLARLYSNTERKADADREYKLYLECRNAEKDTETHTRACNEALNSAAGHAAVAPCAPLFDPNDPEKLVLLGQLYGEHGAFAEAIAPLQRATQVDPGSFDAWHNLGLSYFRLERYPDARLPLEKAVALRPDFFDSLNLLGAVLYMLGDDQAALPVMERAHKIRPDDAQLAQAIRQLQQAKHGPK